MPHSLQHFVDARSVAALRQPDALRPFAEMPFELPAADLDLGPDGVAVDVHQRQKAVRGAAGDDLQLAGLEEAAKAVEQVVVVLLDEHVAGPLKTLVVHLGQVMKLRLPAGAVDFLGGQGDQVVDVADVAVLQQRIAEHGRQRRRDRHGQPPVGPVAFEAVHHFEQRNVGFGDGLVEPVFLEKIVVLGMADEGQMERAGPGRDNREASLSLSSKRKQIADSGSPERGLPSAGIGRFFLRE